MRNLAALAVVSVALVAPSAAAAASTPTLYVSPIGVDTAAGSARAPLATVGAALERLRYRGGVVSVAPGRYPGVWLKTPLSRTVVVKGGVTRSGDATPVKPTRFASFNIAGVKNLTLQDLAVDGPLNITPHPMLRTATRSISINDVEVTNPNGPCLTVRGAEGVSIDRSWVHDCRFGGKILGGTSELTLTRSRINNMVGDGLDLTDVENVIIDQNTISDLDDPTGYTHNDAIQIFGAAKNVEITRNVMHDSSTQILMIQAQTGPNDRVSIINNLMYNAAACGVQVSGTTNLKVINNTIWNTRYAAMMLRPSTQWSIPMGDAVVANNVLSQLSISAGVTTSSIINNVFGAAPRFAAPNNTLAGDPGFVDAARGDYRLVSEAPAKERGATSVAPTTDIGGAVRTSTPSSGAFE